MRTFYVMPLNANSDSQTLNFAAYELRDGSLHSVWPEPTAEERESLRGLDMLSEDWRRGHDRIYRNAAKRLGMVCNRSKNGPRFVFSYGGCGYNKSAALAEDLGRVFGPCVVYDLNNGHAPSKVGVFGEAPQATA